MGVVKECMGAGAPLQVHPQGGNSNFGA